MPAARTSRWWSYFLLTVNAVIWGAALIVVKPAYEVTTPFRYLTYRYLIAIVASLPILLYYLPQVKKLPKQLWTIIWLELIGTTLSLGLLYVGLQQTTAVEASLIATTTPLFTTLCGMFFLKEKEEEHEWLGLGLAFAGTVLLTLIPLLHQTNGLSGFSLWGNLLIVAQNLATGIYFVLAKKRYSKLPKLFVTSVSFYVGLVTFGLLSLLELGGSLPQLWSVIQSDLQAPSVWLASGYMAIFGSIIALTAYIKGQDGIEASEASLFWYLQPLVYLPLGYLWLNEHVYPGQFVALGLILAGVIVAERRNKRKRA